MLAFSMVEKSEFQVHCQRLISLVHNSSVKNHGIPDSCTSHCLGAARAFFSLPDIEKMKVSFSFESHEG